MRQIEPIQFTDAPLIATQLKVIIYNDNLESWCNFNYQLFTVNGELVDTGLATCNGDAYSTWDGNNNFPYTFIAENLNPKLTLLP